MATLDIVLSIVAFLAGVMKSAFGIGAGIFLTPILALVMDPKEAVMVVGIMMLLTDFTALYQYWGKWSTRDVWSLVLPCFIGAVLGALLLNGFSPAMTRRVIGVIGLAYVSLELSRKFLFRANPNAPSSPLRGAIIGTVGGTASALANSGGVFLSTYFAGRLSKESFVGTLVVAFLTQNITKVGMFAGLDMLNTRIWTLELYLLPLMFLGGLAGKWVNNSIKESQFTRLIFFLILIACVKLLVF